MQHSLEDLLRDHGHLEFNRDVMHHVSVMYSLDIREANVLKTPIRTVSSMLTEGFQLEATRKEFFAHYIVEMELKQHRPKQQPTVPLQTVYASA